MKSILFFAAVSLCANAVQPSALVETENSGFDGRGHKLYQGDMILDEELMELLNGSSIDTRKAHHSNLYRWPYAEVQYRLHPSSVGNRAAILAGMQHWEENTCIRFQEVADDYNRPHLIFKKLGGCFSYVGRRYPTGQEISIGEKCTAIGTVAHEIGHALGFHHEQARPDRDEYVVVLERNMNASKMPNFNVEKKAIDLGVAYDLSSVMHYGPDGFGNNNKNTLVTKDPFEHFLIGQRAGLSFADIKLANLMYNCGDYADCESQPSCSNGGFVDMNCLCVCPPGFSGVTCQDGSATPPAALTCGNNVTEATTIQSPNFPSNYPANTKCVWVVTAPLGHNVRAHFNHFDLAGKSGKDNWCISDVLELRTNDLHDGDKYCGSQLDRKEVTSVSNTMVFVFYTKYDNYSGFEARIDFVATPSTCNSVVYFINSK